MMSKKTILLVDDDEELRAALAEQFGLHDGFATVEAATAGEAIDTSVQERLDLILLDVDLPDMDGREACKVMRSRGVRAPIVMLTVGRRRKCASREYERERVPVTPARKTETQDRTGSTCFRQMSPAGAPDGEE